MHTNRRSFLKTAAAAGGALGLGLPATAAAHLASVTPAPYAPPGRAAPPKRILILGGTGFTGPHQVRYALERGHTVSVFNRGRTNPGILPDGVEQLIGDRNGQLDALRGRHWDVVIDNPTTLPRWVRDAGAVLKDSVQQYIFISTISVYASNDEPNADESAATIVLEDPTTEDRAFYGGLKALSEKETARIFPGRATIIRPGLIVGPGDNTDRFTYWPTRIRRGGEILAPGTVHDPAQVIDARDLAEFTIRMAENGTMGTFNATGPAAPYTIGEMLYGIRGVTTTPTKFVWVPADFLAAQEVRPWSDMPVWIPPARSPGFATRNVEKAIAAGLTFRPMADTARATLDWYDTQSDDRKAQLRAGLAPEREREVLAAWTISSQDDA